MLKTEKEVDAPISDSLGRSFRKIRLSVTNACNLACQFCAGTDGETEGFTVTKGLSAKQYHEIVKKLNQKIDIREIHITGGEPTLYNDLVGLVGLLHRSGLGHLKMTTNASKLENKLPALKEAGLNDINISLEAINEEIFYKMTKRQGLSQVTSAIDRALDLGFTIKLNATLMRHVNESEIIPLIYFAAKRNIPLRFLELMKMGPIKEKQFQRHYYSQEEILAEISKHFNFRKEEREKSATAEYWRLDNGLRVGIIANESAPFCSDCDRLRIDSRGQIYGCLSVNSGFAALHADEKQLRESLKSALAQKKTERFSGSNLHMQYIGG